MKTILIWINNILNAQKNAKLIQTLNQRIRRLQNEKDILIRKPESEKASLLKIEHKIFLV